MEIQNPAVFALLFIRFGKLFKEIMSDSFWNKNEWYRLSRIKEGFSVYTEMLDYWTIRLTLNNFKRLFPPGQAELAGDFTRFVRNIFIHFPLYDSWNDIFITKALVNWSKSGQIDKFLKKNAGKGESKFRYWEENKKSMTYLNVKFPKKYDIGVKIYLKDILEEKSGVKFCFILMRKALISSDRVQDMLEDMREDMLEDLNS